MTKKCKNCNCDCHCDGLHGDEYGLCTCENCECREVKDEVPDWKVQTSEWNVEDTRKWKTEDTDRFFYGIEEKKND